MTLGRRLVARRETGLNPVYIVLCLALAALSAPASAAEPIGRLFFTPAQRASLDTARTQRARATLATERTEQEEQREPVPQTVIYGGMVRRSDGKTTLWFNNRAVQDSQAAGSATTINRVRPDGSISLRSSQLGRSVNLKPGQSVELLSGTVAEGYARRPAPQPEPAPKPAAKPAAADTAMAARERAEQEQLRLEDAISRALQETASARPGAPPAPPAAAAPR